MNPTVAQYLGFVVGALILAWGVIEIGRRVVRSRPQRSDTRLINRWVKLDMTHADMDSMQEAPLIVDQDPDDQEDLPEQNHHRRAQQNGHFSGSKKSL